MSDRRTRRGRVTHARLAMRRAIRRGDALVLPAVSDAMGLAGFRRTIGVVAGAALVFFVPALVIAQVPLERWPEMFVLAGAGATVVLSALLTQATSNRDRLLIGVVTAVTVAGIGWIDRGYFNQTALLFAMLVAALAVFHGFGAALVATLIGAALIPVVVQSAETTNITDHVYAAIYLFGAAVLPWSAVRIAERRSVAYRRELHATYATQRETLLILARAAEAKDESAGRHVADVGELSQQLAQRIGMPAAEVDNLRYAAMLHDVGKLHVPDRILLKPGPLNAHEWEVIRRHTTLGAQILGTSPGFELARVVARSHHENWDGTGYPDGLRGEEIALAARVVRLVDVFDALRSRRPYKVAWSIEECLDELDRGAGRHFDPALTPVFVALLRERWESGQLFLPSPRSAVA